MRKSFSRTDEEHKNWYNFGRAIRQYVSRVPEEFISSDTVILFLGILPKGNLKMHQRFGCSYPKCKQEKLLRRNLSLSDLLKSCL